MENLNCFFELNCYWYVFIKRNAFFVRKCFDILLTRPTQWGRAETYQGLQHDRAVIGPCYLAQTRLCFMSHSSARSWRGSLCSLMSFDGNLLSKYFPIVCSKTPKLVSEEEVREFYIRASICLYHLLIIKIFSEKWFYILWKIFWISIPEYHL